MKKKLVAMTCSVVMVLMVFAPAANAQIFYFGSKANSTNSIISNNNYSTQEKTQDYTKFNNIFYFSKRNYRYTNTQPSVPVNNEDENISAPTPTIPQTPEVEPAPVQPEKPTQPVQPKEEVQQPSQPQPPINNSGNVVNAEELKMLDYINQERAKVGVSPLQMDTEVAKVAQIKSQDMVDNNYFSHTSPTYGSPFEMMKKYGVSYRAAGENIAKNSNMLKAHTALMNSQGHRENILNSNYTHIGIGIVQNNTSSGITVTQMFIKK